MAVPLDLEDWEAKGLWPKFRSRIWFPPWSSYSNYRKHETDDIGRPIRDIVRRSTSIPGMRFLRTAVYTGLMMLHTP
jgi:hypothetical protein